VCNALAAAPGLPGAALSDAPAPPAAAAFVTIGARAAPGQQGAALCLLAT